MTDEEEGMTETEEVARAIYECRNGRGCTPWSRLPAGHKAPYLADAMASIRVILERQYPGRVPETPKEPAPPHKGSAGQRG